MRTILLTPQKDYGEVSSSGAVAPVEGCHCLCYAGPTILVTIRGTMVRYPDISGLREKGLKGLTVLRCESIMADTQQQEHEA